MKISTDSRISYDPDIMTVEEASKDMIEIMQNWSRKLSKDNNKGYRILGQPNIILNGVVIPVTKNMNYYDILNIYSLKINRFLNS